MQVAKCIKMKNIKAVKMSGLFSHQCRECKHKCHTYQCTAKKEHSKPTYGKKYANKQIPIYDYKPVTKKEPVYETIYTSKSVPFEEVSYEEKPIQKTRTKTKSERKNFYKTEYYTEQVPQYRSEYDSNQKRWKNWTEYKSVSKSRQVQDWKYEDVPYTETYTEYERVPIYKTKYKIEKVPEQKLIGYKDVTTNEKYIKDYETKTVSEDYIIGHKTVSGTCECSGNHCYDCDTESNSLYYEEIERENANSFHKKTNGCFITFSIVCVIVSIIVLAITFTKFGPYMFSWTGFILLESIVLIQIIVFIFIIILFNCCCN